MRCSFLVVLALAACKKNDPTPPPAPTPAAVQPTAGMVDLFVDDQQVAHVPVSALQSWPRLDSLIPVPARRLGAWDDVYVKTKQPKPSQLHRPSDQYPQLVPALFVSADQTPSFGMFDPVELAKHGKPEVREDNISEVRIALQKGGGRGEHESGEGGATDPEDLKLSIKTAKGASTLDGKKLLDVAREPIPGETDARGWTLATVMKTAGIDKFERILLTDTNGLNLTLEKRDFSATSVPYVKLNRQGSLRVQVFTKQGAGWQRAGDLRGLVSIEVVK
jgi:hypothetical protein